MRVAVTRCYSLGSMGLTGARRDRRERLFDRHGHPMDLWGGKAGVLVLPTLQ